MKKGKDYTVILEKDEDGSIIAEIAGLPGCHSYGASKIEALKNIREALQLYLEVEKNAKPLEFLGVEKLVIAG
ncbi:MAG: type II toxin-antitoxin system HicB family antitoxin [Candidatus Altiarchaeota archaeon]|nr:type II toxin-antitoxin system HicB family antitoxin [Candidatus Altiarchaeota archaeon]